MSKEYVFACTCRDLSVWGKGSKKTSKVDLFWSRWTCNKLNTWAFLHKFIRFNHAIFNNIFYIHKWTNHCVALTWSISKSVHCYYQHVPEIHLYYLIINSHSYFLVQCIGMTIALFLSCKFIIAIMVFVFIDFNKSGILFAILRFIFFALLVLYYACWLPLYKINKMCQ